MLAYLSAEQLGVDFDDVATWIALTRKGVLEAVAAVNGEIADNLVGMDATEQEELDAALKRTKQALRKPQ